MTSLAVFVLLFFAYSLASRRLERTIVSAPNLIHHRRNVNGACLACDPRGRAQVGLLPPPRRNWLGAFALFGCQPYRFERAIERSISAGKVADYGLVADHLVRCNCGAARVSTYLDLGSWNPAAILAPTDAGLGQIIESSRACRRRSAKRSMSKQGSMTVFPIHFSCFSSHWRPLIPKAKTRAADLRPPARAFGAAPRTRPAPGPGSLDGHERRLRDRHRGGCHARPCRAGPLRRAARARLIAGPVVPA